MRKRLIYILLIKFLSLPTFVVDGQAADVNQVSTEGRILKIGKLSHDNISCKNFDCGELDILLNEFAKTINKYSTSNQDIKLTLEIRRQGVNLPTNESFKLILKKGSMTISSNTLNGVIRGVSYLENKLLSGDQLKDGVSRESPSIANRFLCFTVPHSNGFIRAKHIVRMARLNLFNGIVIQIKGSVNLESLESHTGSDTIGRRELVDLVRYAKSFGMEVIPEIKLLTHQEFFDHESSFLINKFTYNPNQTEVIDWAKSLIDEVDEIFDSKYIHLGFDELHGYRTDEQFRNVRKRLSAVDYLEHLKVLNQYVVSKNKRAIIWADMLLDPDRYDAIPKPGLNGRGEFKKMLGRVPQDIVLWDWRYWGSAPLKTYDDLANNGNEVWGVVWCQTESIDNYVKKIISELDHEERTMVTFLGTGALASKREKLKASGMDLVSANDIIRHTGGRFWN